jgi:hypothetical protein
MRRVIGKALLGIANETSAFAVAGFYRVAVIRLI